MVRQLLIHDNAALVRCVCSFMRLLPHPYSQCRDERSAAIHYQKSERGWDHSDAVKIRSHLYTGIRVSQVGQYDIRRTRLHVRNILVEFDSRLS